MKILITGSAGFLGFSLAELLLRKKFMVTGIDNFDDYYSPKYKKKRNDVLKKYKNFTFKKVDITYKKKVNYFFKKNNFDIIFHFAAQAGVRYSVVNPKKYKKVNIDGFYNILDSVKKIKNQKIFYASSSSVYGDSKTFPLNEKDKLYPRNIYAVSKVSNEKLAKIYGNKFKLNLIGLRFFTVYGEWGRPDMLLFKILKSYKKNKTFYLNNKGDHFRDFTYIKDVISILYNLIFIKKFKHNIFNICSSNPINIKTIIDNFCKEYKFKKIKYVKKNKLEVYKTYGSNRLIKQVTKFKEFTNFRLGLKKTISWYLKNQAWKY
jgi:UDP-glucuronate 4-epimerase